MLQDTESAISDSALTTGPPRSACEVRLRSPAVKMTFMSAAGLRLQSPALKELLTFTPTGKSSCSACTLPTRIFPAFPVFTSASLAWILV